MYERNNHWTTTYGGSWLVSTTSVFYDDMDVDVYMDVIPLEVSYRDQLKVYMIQIMCYSIFIWR